MLVEDDEKVFAYLRTNETDRFLVVLNFSEYETRFLWPEGAGYSSQKLVISNYVVNEADEVTDSKLRPFEARIYKLS